MNDINKDRLELQNIIDSAPPGMMQRNRLTWKNWWRIRRLYPCYSIMFIPGTYLLDGSLHFKNHTAVHGYGVVLIIKGTAPLIEAGNSFQCYGLTFLKSNTRKEVKP